jgi:DUF2075 family protein
MIDKVKKRNKEVKLSRVVAGYSWKWRSKKKPNLKDIVIENCELKWNSPVKNWIHSTNAINEVGCIHTTQGYDLNYAGVIFGKEISYDPKKNEIIIIKENYCDINGKSGILNPNDLKDYILNIYATLLQRGIRGTYVYVCDPALKAYFSKHIVKADPNIHNPVSPEDNDVL